MALDPDKHELGAHQGIERAQGGAGGKGGVFLIGRGALNPGPGCQGTERAWSEEASGFASEPCRDFRWSYASGDDRLTRRIDVHNVEGGLEGRGLALGLVN